MGSLLRNTKKRFLLLKCKTLSKKIVSQEIVTVKFEEIFEDNAWLFKRLKDNLKGFGDFKNKQKSVWMFFDM